MYACILINCAGIVKALCIKEEFYNHTREEVP